MTHLNRTPAKSCSPATRFHLRNGRLMGFFSRSEKRHWFCLLLLLAGPLSSASLAWQAAAVTTARQPWTESRLGSSPEPPLPLEAVPAFPQLKFQDPMHVRWQPDLQRYFVCELRGRIFSFPHAESVTTADLATDLKQELRSFDPQRSNGVQDVYSIAFDPDFARNRFIYVMMVLSSKLGEPLTDGSRVSRFQVTTDSPPRIDVSSELPLISWLAGGHNGCDLAFDNSGCLLISTGDATDPSPPDGLQTGQNLSDLLSCILRIDVRDAAPGRPYRIPADNPFINHPDAKPEIWAFGFRNPWRISVDRPTGRVHAGDVGWEKWEMVHEIFAGGNYGWSVLEGPERIQPQLAEGPGPVRAPLVALPHSEAASVTGGFVCRSSLLPEVANNYLFGDWVTGRMWTLPLDGPASPRLVASTPLRIIAFSPDREGLPLVVNHFAGTTLFRLQPTADLAARQTAAAAFPRQLSRTGLFTSTADHVWSAGVREFEIQHPAWHDGASARRAIGLPQLAQAIVYPSPQPLEEIAMFNSRLHYPAGTVLAKTLELDGRRLETQVLQFDGRLWQAFSFVWNQDQTDAELAPADGLEIPLPGHPGRTWRVHSRAECFQCHNLWAETTLAFTPEQLHSASAGDNSPWLQLVREGYAAPQNAEGKAVSPESCVRKALTRESTAPLADRARSWLHANCAHCHQQNAGSGLTLSLRSHDADADTGLFDMPPAKGSFGMTSARIIAPGLPQQSTLLYRVASSSVGRMPHIGSREVDFAGVAMLTDWIAGLPAKSDDAAAAKTTHSDIETNRITQLLLDHILAVRKAASTDTAPAGTPAPPGSGIKEDTTFAMRQVILPLAHLAAAHSDAAPGTSLPESLRPLVKTLASSMDTINSSLFEAHLPSAERQQRLSPQAVFADIAGITGDAERGRQLFQTAAHLQCAKCHQPDPAGRRIGPDLANIGRRASPEQLFESIANPDRRIEPQYQTRIVITTSGKTLIGLVESETDGELVLANAAGERHRIPSAEIESQTRDTKSLMPSGLSSQLTAQNMADLLAWLSTAK
ncbi:MAG: PQQ-dependent sugar dehydrogenase [Planctomycetaceae bacterium]